MLNVHFGAILIVVGVLLLPEVTLPACLIIVLGFYVWSAAVDR